MTCLRVKRSFLVNRKLPLSMLPAAGSFHGTSCSNCMDSAGTALAAAVADGLHGFPFAN